MPPHPKPLARAAKPGSFKGKSARLSKPRGFEAERLQSEPTAPTKGSIIQAMLLKGATSKELEAATGWAAHSVRGFLGTLRKRGTRVISTKLPKQPTVYSVETEVL